MRWFIVVLSAACVAAPAFAGTLKVCRQAGITTLHDKQPIVLPTGTRFADVGPASGAILENSYLPVNLLTDTDATIPVGRRCASVKAHVDVNPKRLAVGPSMKRLYHLSGGPDVDLDAYAATAF